MKKIARLIAFPALALGLGACAGQTVTAAPAPEAVVAQAAVAVNAPTPEEAFLTDLVGPGADVAPAVAADLIELGWNTCDGFTAGVPTDTMTDTLVRFHGMTPDEATEFVATAAADLCERPQV
jgi:hypothetical protein